MPDYLSNLNAKQKEAVTAPLGPVLVLAGAGSGKTRALTMRICYLLREGLFRPEDILALTFTNKAAGEMRERIQRITNQESRITDKKSRDSNFVLRDTVTMGTFHSVCVRILRQDIEKLGRGYGRNFVIYDSDDSLRLLKQIVIEQGLAERFKPQLFAYYINAAKNRLAAPSEIITENEYVLEVVQEVYEEYDQRLREANALDFDDLLKLTCELFQDSPRVLEKYRERFKYILVDEYQDTNHAQYLMLKLLTKTRQNLFVVGDDAQSIYGFRGANMQNILDFKKDYPKATIVMLEQNYRSTKSILDAANRVIALNPFQYEKNLWTDNGGGEKISLYEAQDETDEGEFVLRRIMKHESRITGPLSRFAGEGQGEGNSRYEIRDSILDRFIRSPRYRPTIELTEIPGDLNQTVILYRTHAQSRPLEEVFLSAGIPYQIIGGMKFYERREIKDTLAYLRLLVNSKDLVSLSRVINVPARGIGAVGFREVQDTLAAYEYNFERLHLNLDSASLSARALAGAKEFFDLFLKAQTVGQDKNILDIMHFLLVRSGYKEDLLKDGDGETRWENIEELFNVAGRFSKVPWQEGIPLLLEEVALMTDLDKMEGEDSNKLTLMTLHSAKGLEFDNVFFVGLEEGLLPHSRSMSSPHELAEEIRLAYVGITRARKNLYLSYARTRQVYGELKRSAPSRILKAIPKKLINRIMNHESRINGSLSRFAGEGQGEGNS